MSKDNGGPAFPLNAYNEGMSMRDYFAAKALAVWVQAHIDQSVDDLSKTEIARECYSYAEAMLKERDK